MAKNEKKKNHRTSSLSRPQGIREVKQSFLIVWEEMCTEPDYFKAFSMTMVNINAVYQGMNIISLVNKAISIRDTDTHANFLVSNMEKAGNKIIEKIKMEEVRVCIPPVIFMSMLIAIILMVGMLVMIAYFNQESIHSNDIDAILGWGIAGYTVFIVLVVWFLS